MNIVLRQNIQQFILKCEKCSKYRIFNKLSANEHYSIFSSSKLYLFPRTVNIYLHNSLTKTPARWEQQIAFHTSQRRNTTPLLALLVRGAAALTGRFVRKRYNKLSPEQKKKIWDKLKKHWYMPTGGAVGVCGYALWYYLSHIEETPITGRKRFMALTIDQVKEIADAESEQLRELFAEKVFRETDFESQRVFQVMLRLLKANPEMNSNLGFDNWTIYVIDQPLANAFVLPNGSVFVFKGMLDMASSQDELAVVLAHEVAHAVLSHGVEELSMSNMVDVVRIVCLAAIWCIMPGDGIAVITHWFFNKVIHLMKNMPHSRKIETEADKVGIMFAAKACFDVRAGPVLWKKMAMSEKVENISKGEGALPEFMSTHPASDKRAEYLDSLLPKAIEVRSHAKCPRLSTTDPRQVIEELSKKVENHITALQAGQRVTQVTKLK